MHKSNKIKSLDELAEILNRLRAEDPGKMVVHCHGVFDLLHIGHIRYFQAARKLGDILAVTLTPDHYVNKGPHRPVFTEALRSEAIAALEFVDYVAINRWPTAVETIKLLKPNFYVKGSDYKDAKNDLTGKIVDEQQAVQSVGGQISFTDDIVFSSSTLINRHLPVFPKEISDYLKDFATRYTTAEVLKYLEDARGFKVLVVGEAIIDEYQYCEQMGKSAKEPILATRLTSTEKFAGGSLAVANHVANFCDHVSLFAMLGTENTQEDFVRDHLHPNVEPIFFYKEDSPTIIKRRFVESYLLQKLFEIYEMDDSELSEAQNRAVCQKLEEILPRYDVVIVADYGHAMLTKDAISLLCGKSKFLAVNTQANAGNRGFNTVSKYPRADFVSIARHEIALEERNRDADPGDMILNLAHKIDYGNIIVTVGKNGIVGYNESEGFVQVPAFAHRVVDRIGAGDAVLSLTALCVAQQAPIEIVAFLGNVVGAEAVQIMGNRRSIESVPLFKHIISLLK